MPHRVSATVRPSTATLRTRPSAGTSTRSTRCQLPAPTRERLRPCRKPERPSPFSPCSQPGVTGARTLRGALSLDARRDLGAAQVQAERDAGYRRQLVQHVRALAEDPVDREAGPLPGLALRGVDELAEVRRVDLDITAAQPRELRRLLPVGDDVETHALLHGDHLVDGPVLDLLVGRRLELAGLGLLARELQVLRAQQRPDGVAR